MEKIFKNIKPNPYPMKNKGGRIGYGCLYGKRTKYNKVAKRKVGRWIRKKGFNCSECWGLDYAISAWLSDYVGGFFRQCGQMDTWMDYDLEGNPLSLTKDTKDCIAAEEGRIAEFKTQLSNFLKADNLLKDKFVAFVCPRLKFLSEYSHGYPPSFSSYKDWQECLKGMCQDLEHDRYSEDFVKYFYCLWD